MCGIVGYVGYKEASTVLLNGLKRLEYARTWAASIRSIELTQKFTPRPLRQTPAPKAFAPNYRS